MPLTRTELTECLRRRGFAVAVQDLGQSLAIVATTAGGRVFGPFLGEEDLLGWTPAPSDFDAALGARQWNIGGERVWLAPERAFNFSDAAAMLETYKVDPALDPGLWRLRALGLGLELQGESTLPRRDGGSRVVAKVTRQILPLGPVPNDGRGAIRAGYRHTITVRYAPNQDGLAVAPWLLRQVSLGGVARLSAAPDGMGQIVFGEAPHEAITPMGRAWSVTFGPRGFFKTSYGRNAIGLDGLSYEMTRSGKVVRLEYRPQLTAAALYPETLPHDPGGPGQTAALFRDDGRFGTYGELELYGHRAGANAGRLVVDTVLRLYDASVGM